MSLSEKWALFPLWPVEKGKCGCGDGGCTRVGKHPATYWSEVGPGEQMPIPDSYGVGICTGSRSGIFVLDFDTVEAFESMAPRLPLTHSVATGRGVHLYFLQPEGRIKTSASQLAPGVDVRGEGGFVVAAGSLHKSGKVYEVMDGRDPVAAPQWLLDELTSQPETYAPKAPTPVDGAELDRRMSVAISYLEKAPACVMSEGPGGSGKLWTIALYLMRRLELPQSVAAELVASVYNPRCDPPWSDEEIRHKLEDARDKSAIPTGIAPVGFGTVSVAIVPDSAYKHTPGHNAAESECKKTSFTDLVQALYGHPDWLDVLRFDVFRRRAVAVKPPLRMSLETSGLSNVDISGVRTWFEAHGVAVGSDECARAIECACQRREFHPVKEYLHGLQPGDPSIIERLATLGLGSKDPMAPDLMRKFLVSAVRRILKPGCQVDTMPVLVGKQGARKTSFVRSLFGHEWCRSQMPDLATKDASQALAGFWGIELAELDRVLRAESSTVKEFLTRTFDDYRPPYGRTDLRFPRECVFIGTVNEWEFLRDPTGSRRFQPITVDRASTDWVEQYRDAIWGAAVALEAAGEPHWYEDETELDSMREAFVETDVWHEKIESYCQGREWVDNTTDVFVHLGGKVENADQRVKNRIGGTLRRLGCVRHTRKVGGRVTSNWKVPATMAGIKPNKQMPSWRKQ